MTPRTTPLTTKSSALFLPVAYRDMENKNKAVSEKIREYADMMFGRMAKYQNEVAEIVTEVNEMQLKQKKALEKLCSEAAEKLDMLTAASDKTLSDMQRIGGQQKRHLRPNRKHDKRDHRHRQGSQSPFKAVARNTV